MPFQSRAQKEYLRINEPEIYERWMVVEEDNPPQLHSVYRKYPMEKVAMAIVVIMDADLGKLPKWEVKPPPPMDGVPKK